MESCIRRMANTEEEVATIRLYQILVKNLEGRTRCLQFSSREVPVEVLHEELRAREGVPCELQRLVCGTRELGSGSCIVADEDGVFPSCSLLLRLRGGKGGFGSLLRGAATKAGQKKTSNFDACRDLSGRRLRHVNAEKKLKEWKSEGNERELEKTAEEFLKKQRKVEEEDSGLAKELERLRKESLKAREDIRSAVTDGLVEVRKLGVDLKRKKIEAVEVEVKKARFRMLNDSEDEDSDEDSSSSSDSENEDEACPSSSAEIEQQGSKEGPSGKSSPEMEQQGSKEGRSGKSSPEMEQEGGSGK